MKPEALTFVVAFFIAAWAPSPGRATTPTVAHSYNDDGLTSGTAYLPIGGQITLHLYLVGGETESASGTVCETGTGDEHCGYSITVEADGATQFLSFSADPTSAFDLGPTRLKIVGGNFIDGELGAAKIGDVVIDAGGTGTVKLRLSSRVSAALEEDIIAPIVVAAVPEPNSTTSLVVASVILAGLARRRRRRARRSIRVRT